MNIFELKNEWIFGDNNKQPQQQKTSTNICLKID